MNFISQHFFFLFRGLHSLFVSGMGKPMFKVGPSTSTVSMVVAPLIGVK